MKIAEMADPNEALIHINSSACFILFITSVSCALCKRLKKAVSEVEVTGLVGAISIVLDDENVDLWESILLSYDVSTIPTTLLFCNSEIIQKWSGFYDDAEEEKDQIRLDMLISSALNCYPSPEKG